MEKLLTPGDIAERYQCSMPTARKYMRQMEHMESPLTVTELAVRAWEAKRTCEPGETLKQAMTPKKRQRIKHTQIPPGEMRIPTRRPA